MSRKDVLIDTRELYTRLRQGDDIVVLSVGAANEGIPGAFAADPAVFAGEGGSTKGARPLPEVADLQRAVRGWGINDDTEVVLYDSNGNVTAARGWWTLKWAGLRHVRLLDGGLAAWEQEGLPFAALDIIDGRGTAILSPGHLPQVDADEAEAHACAHVLLDARAAKAYAAGHIPGARNLPANGNLDGDDRFLSDDMLSVRYAFARGQKVAVSCGSGVSAAHDIAVLAILDIPAALYVASWSGWSADPARPVALETA